jgi:hypothetical protein
MPINYLHKNFYKLNRYFLRHLSEKKFDDRRMDSSRTGNDCARQMLPRSICQQVVGMSGSSYYRYRRRMVEGQTLKRSKRPKQLRKHQWTENDCQPILMIRRQKCVEP